MVRKTFALTMIFVLGLTVVSTVYGQGQRQRGQGGQPQGRQRGGFGQRGGGGFGGGGDVTGTMLTAVRSEKIQGILEILDEQKADLDKMMAELRGDRGAGGRAQGGRPGGGRVQGGAGRNPRDLSEEERAKLIAERRKEQAERNKKIKEKLGEVLLPHQMDRLQEIAIQLLDLRALSDTEVAAKLKITEEQKKKMEEVRTKSREAMMAKFQEARQNGGGFEGIREMMTKANEETNKKVMAELTAAQKSEFEKMKGKKADVSMQDLFSGFGRGGRPGAGGRPGGGGRPQRPGGGDSGRPQRPGSGNDN